jgi:site-specific DNA-methyltransferase (cytosine-N4-specific)
LAFLLEFKMINTCLFGDAVDCLQSLLPEHAGTIQTCITSPPYFGLRDYGVCGQIGNEETIEEYVQSIVAVFDIVWDLLADNGTLWLNLGDSYAGSGKGRYKDNKAYPSTGSKQQTNKGAVSGTLKKTPLSGDLKPKDLIGVPWRVAFALQAKGWWLRQDIIWHKKNTMPEPVKDRCTRSHEYLFLLSKSRKYYFDNEAIKEPTAYQKRNKRSVWTLASNTASTKHHAVFPPGLIIPPILASTRLNDVVLDPFMGSGTTAAVATKLGRRWIGCELNQEYEDVQRAKIHNLKLKL